MVDIVMIRTFEQAKIERLPLFRGCPSSTG